MQYIDCVSGAYAIVEVKVFIEELVEVFLCQALLFWQWKQS